MADGADDAPDAWDEAVAGGFVKREDVPLMKELATTPPAEPFYSRDRFERSLELTRGVVIHDADLDKLIDQERFVVLGEDGRLRELRLRLARGVLHDLAPENVPPIMRIEDRVFYLRERAPGSLLQPAVVVCVHPAEPYTAGVETARALKEPKTIPEPGE